MSAARVCRAARMALGVDGAALNMISGHGDRVTLAHSGRLSTRLAQLQWTTGIGPDVDASATHHPVWVTDLASPASQTRWPGFAAAAVELGVGAVFALPLLVGASCCGTLQLHRVRPGRLSPSQVREALGLAEAALAALLDARAGITRHPDEPTDPFGDGQDEIFQASGMVAVQLGVGVDEALVRLRAHAFAHDQSLDHVATDVIGRRLRLAPLPDPG